MKKRLIVLLAACVVGSLVVDRIALYVWQLQVLRLYHDITTAIQENRATPQAGKTGFVAFGTESFLVMPRDQRWPARYVTVRTDRALLNVNSVTVDGAGDLHLRFFPPFLAWTTRLFPRDSYTHHGDPTGLDPRFHYQFKLDLSLSSPGPESATLQRGEYHFAAPLQGADLRAKWFY